MVNYTGEVEIEEEGELMNEDQGMKMMHACNVHAGGIGINDDGH